MFISRRISKIRTLLLLSALLLQGGWITLIAAHQFAEDPAPEKYIPSLLNGTRVVSDLDGDMKPDPAQARPDGDGYKIDIRLSNLSRRTSFNFVSNEPSISLLAYDIDHDNDNDIVVISSVTLQPLAVWLNDGNGNFDRDENWSAIDYLTGDNAPSYEQKSSPANPVLTSRNEQSPFDKTIVRVATADTARSETVLVRRPAPALSIFAFQLSPRSPPSTLSL